MKRVLLLVFFVSLFCTACTESKKDVDTTGKVSQPVVVDADSQEKAKELLERGISSYDQEDMDTSLVYFNGAIKLDPYLAAAYDRRGRYYRVMEKPDLAIKDCSKAISLDPNLAAAYWDRAIAYSQLNNYDLAIIDCNKVIRIDPEFPRVYNTLGNAYYDNGNHDMALDKYTLSISREPDYSLAYINRSLIYREREEYDLAIADCTQAIRIDPKDVTAYLYRGRAYVKKGDYSRATADFNKVIEISPNSITANAAVVEIDSMPVIIEARNKTIEDIIVDLLLDKKTNNFKTFIIRNVTFSSFVTMEPIVSSAWGSWFRSPETYQLHHEMGSGRDGVLFYFHPAEDDRAAQRYMLEKKATRNWGIKKRVSFSGVFHVVSHNYFGDIVETCYFVIETLEIDGAKFTGTLP